MIELIIAIAIMAITVPAVMGAVLLAVDSSSQDRRLVQAQQLLTSWSETINRANTDVSYTSCPSTACYSTGPFAPNPALPAGFSASVVSIDFWQSSTNSFTTCCDEGVRRLRLRIHVDPSLYPGFDLERYVLLRRPCATATTC